MDSDIPERPGSASPVNSGAVLSGNADAGDGFEEDTLITDITPSYGGSSAASGTNDSGGALVESAGGIGGATSSKGGAAGAGNAGRGGTGGSGGGAGRGGAGGSAGGAPVAPPALYFSEYVEGSSSFKALEIAAQKRSVLDGCKVGAYFNGKAEPTVVATLSGVLEAGKVLTVCSSSLQEKLASACNQVGNLTFNGDDALAISCDGKVLDVIGQLGIDPGTAWGSAANATADHTLRRKCSITAGNPNGLDAFDPSSEWQAFPIDTFSGLGSRGC